MSAITVQATGPLLEPLAGWPCFMLSGNNDPVAVDVDGTGK